MLMGICECQKVHLSSIARALKENISLKKTIERLSRNLMEIANLDLVFENYLKEIKEDTKDRSIVIIDGSEVVKPASTVLEEICDVRDGSTGEYKKGYWMLEMMILSSKNKQPLPIYSKIYSSKEEGYISEDDEVLKENRNVIYKGKRENIMSVAKKHKGKYIMNFRGRKGKNIELKISIIPVRLCEFREKEINLIVVYGFGEEPMLLLSNLDSRDERIAEVITKVYLMRWRIEEYFKFKKQQFKFEDFRVRKIKAIKNLNILVTIIIGIIGMMSEKQKTSKLVMEIIEKSRRIYGKKKFVYYALADGIYEILKKSTKGIKDLLCPKTPDITGQIDILYNIL